MSESTSVTDHINNLNTLFAQLSTADFNIIENERADLLLQSLPDLYDQLVINITNYNVIDLLRFEDVAGALLEEEYRRKNKEDMVESARQIEALVMTIGRSTEREPSGSQSHEAKRWHVKKDCWHLKNGGKNSEAPTSQGCMANTSEEEDIL